MKKVIIIFLITMLTFGCSCNKENKKTNKFKQEYESLNNKINDDGFTYQELKIKDINSIKYSSVDEITNIIKNDSGVIYLGYPECILCRSVIPSLMNAAEETGLESIYYLNTKNGIDNRLYDLLSGYIKDIKNDYPIVIFVNEGKIVDVYKETINNKIKLTESEQKKLKNIYKDYIYQLSDDLCDESC